MLAVFVIALSARLAVIAGAAIFHVGYLVGDEQQYIGLAEAVASGRGPESWFPGYGASLYRSTIAFSGPLSFLVWVFGPHLTVGRLMSAVLGAAVAALTVVLARRSLPVGWAFAAGLVPALLPSQVFWSSALLRESDVWLALVVAAIAAGAAARAQRATRVLVFAGAVAACIVLLAEVREQTALEAAWALPLAAVIGWGRRPFVLLGAACLVAVSAPWLGGMGPAGISLVRAAAPNLGTTRTVLSIGADSAFVPHHTETPLPSAPSVVSPKPLGTPKSPRDRAAASPRPTATLARIDNGLPSGPEVKNEGGQRILAGPGGASYVVNDGIGADLRALPRGVVGVLFRPFAWDTAPNTSVLIAKLENIAWYALYALAFVGIWANRQRRDLVAYPFVVSCAILGGAALTEGNVGTAFRHRGQVLWALAVLAAVGLHHLRLLRRAA